jgi:hypothetical protein
LAAIVISVVVKTYISVLTARPHSYGLVEDREESYVFPAVKKPAFHSRSECRSQHFNGRFGSDVVASSNRL